ncbi:MAG: NapC/NirT family cytochrome c [Bradyrhizobium sp.]
MHKSFSGHFSDLPRNHPLLRSVLKAWRIMWTTPIDPGSSVNRSSIAAEGMPGRAVGDASPHGESLLASGGARLSFAWMLIFSLAGATLLLGGFNWAVEWTNTEAFCISCHEMRNTPYAEMQGTIHDKNRSGVRATCADCHVPKEWIDKLVAKVKASKDLYHHLLGTYDTLDKFESHRPMLAERVWSSMKENDSRACRNCHSIDSMDRHRQAPASHVMMLAEKSGATCIDCHKGIAHFLPKRGVAPDPQLGDLSPQAGRGEAPAIVTPPRT